VKSQLSRRTLMLAAASGALAGLASLAGASAPTELAAVPVATLRRPRPTPRPTPTPTPGKAVLRWSPNPAVNGLTGPSRAFEGIEDHPHPPPGDPEAGKTHIFADPDKYRWVMRKDQRDTLAAGGAADRQRNEVAGMLDPHGNPVRMLLGQTWRITYSMYIPSTLQPTTHFTHIMQMKQPGTGTTPIVTTSLALNGSVAQIQVQVETAGVVVAATNLAPLHDHWINTSIEMLFGSKGSLHWILTDPSLPAGSSPVVDRKMTGINVWLAGSSRLWPKFGIYRSCLDPTHLQDTELWIKDFKVYQIV
jgi:hypothetical protein